ncbi:salivary glue protein Sgs-3-like [Clytia hemisphaerica]|uniref:Chitin-binding type-2 domain-containing protein n=1 Tax=Clytia hemisphaerica TaxID=252671 RepID=A0A7M5X386_9CNID
MKILATLAIVALVSALSEAGRGHPNKCPKSLCHYKDNGVPFQRSGQPGVFVTCVFGRPICRPCPTGLVFSDKLRTCVSLNPPTTGKAPTTVARPTSTTQKRPTTRPIPCPSKACHGKKDGSVFRLSSRRANIFVTCDNGKAVCRRCSKGLVFINRLQTCADPNQPTTSKPRTTRQQRPTTTRAPKTTRQQRPTTTRKPRTTRQQRPTTTRKPRTTRQQRPTTRRPSVPCPNVLCKHKPENAIFRLSSRRPNYFVRCVSHRAICQRCPGNLIFSNKAETCVRVPEAPTSTRKPRTTQRKPTTVQRKPTTTQRKPTTVQQKPTTTQRKPTTVQQKPTTTRRPLSCKNSLCKNRHGDAFFADPHRPSVFVRCVNYKPICQRCPSGLVFNNKAQACDFPKKQKKH